MTTGSQFAQYINPLLAVLKDLGGSARSSEAKAAVAEHLQLSDEAVEDQLESGSSRFDNQVSWARTTWCVPATSTHRGVGCGP